LICIDIVRDDVVADAANLPGLLYGVTPIPPASTARRIAGVVGWVPLAHPAERTNLLLSASVI
jgi:hypothetical protein